MLTSGISNAQKLAQLSLATIQKLDSISVMDVPKGAPGIACGIVMDGKIVYRKYAGYANLQDSTLIGPASRFNIASNGKQFTALAILTLAHQKKLTLKDDIRKFFPNLFPAISEKISVEHLLSHTSGIRDVYDLWALQGITWWQETFDNKDVLNLLSKQKELNFKPGTKYAYSNSNYILLALLVEKASNQSFIDYTNAMFKKLNMLNTSFEGNFLNIKGPIALPYFNFNTWTGYEWICNIHGDGNMFSTLEDQLQWEKILQTKKSKLPKSLIEQTQQLTPSRFTKDYGYGVEFGEYKEIPYKFHEGSTGAWKATTIRFGKKNFTIVTLTNSGKTIPAMQSRMMADVLLDISGNPGNYRIAPEAIGSYQAVDKLTGIYQTENGFTFKFEQRDTSLFLLRQGRNDIRLEREAANIFHQWNDPDFKQEFSINEKGEMQVTAYYTEHAPYSLTRPNADWSKFNHASLDGNYVNEETGVTIKLKFQSSGGYLADIAGENQNATIVTPDKLMVGSYSLKVIKGESGKIHALLLDGGRISNVRFTRIP